MNRLLELEKLLRVYDSCETVAHLKGAATYAYLMYKHWARVCPDMLAGPALAVIVDKAQETCLRLQAS